MNRILNLYLKKILSIFLGIALFSGAIQPVEASSGNVEKYLKEICDLCYDAVAFGIGILTDNVVRPMGGCGLQKEGRGFYIFGKVGPGSLLPVYTTTVYYPISAKLCKVEEYKFNICTGKLTNGVAKLVGLMDTVDHRKFGSRIDPMIASGQLLRDLLVWVTERTGGFALSLGINTHSKNISVYLSTAKDISNSSIEKIKNHSLVQAVMKFAGSIGKKITFHAGRKIKDNFYIKTNPIPVPGCNSPVVFVYLFGTHDVGYDECTDKQIKTLPIRDIYYDWKKLIGTCDTVHNPPKKIGDMDAAFQWTRSEVSKKQQFYLNTDNVVCPGNIIYFLRRDDYLGYVKVAPAGGESTAGAVKRISDRWKFPSGYRNDINAALPTLDGSGMYVFKGKNYFGYVNGKAGNVKSIVSRWPALPANFHSGIDAAFRARAKTTFAKAVYAYVFLKGDEYFFAEGYNSVLFKVKQFGKIKELFRNIPLEFQKNIDAALHYGEGKFQGRYYLFKGQKYFGVDNIGGTAGSAEPIDKRWKCVKFYK